MSLSALVRSVAVCAVLTALALAPSTARADHAITFDGLCLFNVELRDNHTTWSRPMLVIHQPDSFTVRYTGGGALDALSGRNSLHWIADYVSTTTILNKAGARQFIVDHRWHMLRRPGSYVLADPTPFPAPTRTPVPKATPRPESLASKTLPLNERVTAQLNIFLAEQQGLSSQIKLARTAGQVSEATARKKRLDLLALHSAILQDYYPGDQESVKQAKAFVDQQAESVRTTGVFVGEN